MIFIVVVSAGTSGVAMEETTGVNQVRVNIEICAY